MFLGLSLESASFQDNGIPLSLLFADGTLNSRFNSFHNLFYRIMFCIRTPVVYPCYLWSVAILRLTELVVSLELPLNYLTSFKYPTG